MFIKLNLEQRAIVIQAATNYIASTSIAYDPEYLSENLDQICDILAAKLLETSSSGKSEKNPF